MGSYILPLLHIYMDEETNFLLLGYYDQTFIRYLDPWSLYESHHLGGAANPVVHRSRINSGISVRVTPSGTWGTLLSKG